MSDPIPALPAHENAGKSDWTSVFLAELAATGNVSAAARAAGVNRDTPYGRRQTDPAFAAAWDSSLEEACDLLELEARRRAFAGVVEPVFYKGAECGRINKYSDTLMIVLLKAHRPEKYRERVATEHSGEVKVVIAYDEGDPPFDAPTAPGADGGPGVDGPV